MTDEPSTAHADEADGAVEPAGEGPAEENAESGNSEAAKYRRRLREAEAERDALREQVDGLRRAEVERQVADDLEDPSDLWRAGADVGELLDDQGAVDRGKVDQAVLSVVTEHPGWRKRPQSAPDVDQGRSSDMPSAASWAGLVRSRSGEAG